MNLDVLEAVIKGHVRGDSKVFNTNRKLIIHDRFLKTFYLSMCIYKCACTVGMGPIQILLCCLLFFHVNAFLSILEKTTFIAGNEKGETEFCIRIIKIYMSFTFKGLISRNESRNCGKWYHQRCYRARLTVKTKFQ